MAKMKKVMNVLTIQDKTVLKCPVGKEIVIFSGIVSNIDITSRATYFVTVLVNDGVQPRQILHKIPVPYHSSLEMPKIVLTEGDELIFHTSADRVLDVYISYVER